MVRQWANNFLEGGPEGPTTVPEVVVGPETDAINCSTSFFCSVLDALLGGVLELSSKTYYGIECELLHLDCMTCYIQGILIVIVKEYRVQVIATPHQYISEEG